MVGVTRSLGMTRCSITDMSGFTNSPPLNAAMGVSIARGSINIAMPLGGRPLVSAKRMSGGVELVHRLDGSVGQHLVLGDERAVDVGEHEADLRFRHVGSLRTDPARVQGLHACAWICTVRP